MAFVLALYAVLPQYSLAKKSKSETWQKEKEFNELQNYFVGLKSDLEELSGYQDSLQKIDTALPGGVELAPLLSFFNQKAIDNGLVLKAMAQSQISPADSEGTSTSGIQAAYFVVNIAGEISSLENFLKDIENSARLVDVVNIALQQQNEAAPAEINILVKVYY